MIRILLVSFGSEWHDDVWNVLAIESIKGDLKGLFKEDISIKEKRFYNKNEINIFARSSNISMEYDLIGCSVEIGSHNLLDDFLLHLSEVNYSKALVLGGVLPTYAYDYLITLKSVQKLKPIFIIGEGEIALRNLVDCLMHKDLVSYENEPNTFQFNKKSQNYIMNTTQTVDLEKLIYSPEPISYTSMDYKIRIIQASRNCIFGCTYCSQGPNKKWRSFSYDRIKENLEVFIKTGCYEFEFVDDEFFGGNKSYNIDRAWKICDIVENVSNQFSCKLRFRIFTNPNIITSENVGYNNISFVHVLKRLKKLGLSRVYLGVESGAADQRKRYNRRDTLEECSKSISMLESLGIEIDVGFIMFDPEVTLKDISENIDFIQYNNILKYNTWPLRPMILTAHTPMFQRAEKLGIVTKRNDYNIASFEYVFLNSDVAMIFSRISRIADRTAKVFYILKYIYKNNFYETKLHDETQVISDFLMENAMINFDCIKEMIALFQNNSANDNSLNIVTDNAFRNEYNLIEKIEKKMSELKLLSDDSGNLREAIYNSKFAICHETNIFK